MEDKKIYELMRLCLVQGSSLKMKDLERITELSLELISAYRAVELDRNNWRKQALEEDASHSEFVDFIRKHNDESSHAEYVKFREGPALKWLRQLKEIKIPDGYDHRDDFIRYLISEQLNEKGTTMDADVYQYEAQAFATGGGKTLIYCLLGAIEELGELIEKIDFPKLVNKDLPFGDVTNSAAYTLKKFVDFSKEAGKTAKQIRKEWATFSDEIKTSLTSVEIDDDCIDKEAGDVAWMLSGICERLDFTLGDVMKQNLQKLTDRKSRGVIVGEGDNR